MNQKISLILVTFMMLISSFSIPAFANICNAEESPKAITSAGELTLTYNGQQKTYNLNDLLSFDSVTGNGGKLKVTGTITGPFEYTGVRLTTLAGEFPTLSNEYTMVAIADDGYTMSYNFEEIQGNVMVYDTNGNEIGVGGVSMILATMENGETDYPGAYRIAFVNDNEPITDAFLWAKYIVEIEFIDASTDTTPPTISIEKPKNALYLFDTMLLPYSMPFIIGGITISVNAYDDSGIARVLFVINEELKEEKTSTPYQWTWDETIIGSSLIQVVVYDTAGNLAEIETNVMMINPF